MEKALLLKFYRESHRLKLTGQAAGLDELDILLHSIRDFDQCSLFQELNLNRYEIERQALARKALEEIQKQDGNFNVVRFKVFSFRTDSTALNE